MNFGIAGRKAIVCASSRGLGYGCAMALAQEGCEVVINGRDAKRLEATAAEIAKATGAKIIPVAADVATPEGQKALFAACPSPTSWSTTMPARRCATSANCRASR